jgi:hypothetical protein
MLIGLHGGQLYNQFFASTDTAILELVGLDKRGLLHGQLDELSKPKLAH